MRPRTLKLLIAVLIVLGTTAGTLASTRAQVSIGVTPSVLDLFADPGDEGVQDITVFNDSEQPVAATVEVDQLGNVADDYSAVEWLSVEPREVELQPGEETAVLLSIDVPDDIASGGRYASVKVTTKAAERDDAGSGVTIAGQLVVGVLFTVIGDGDVVKEISVEQFAPVLEPDGRVGFHGQMTNTGNIHITGTGHADLFGNESDDEPVASLELETSLLLPTVSRNETAQGTLPTPRGETLRYSGEIYAGDPEEDDDLDPIEVEGEFTVEPVLDISASICENFDGGPIVSVDLINGGDLGLAPVLTMTLTNDTGLEFVTLQPKERVIGWPKMTTQEEFDIPERLVTGNYTLRIQALIVDGLDPVVTELPFSIGGENAAPLCEGTGF